MSFNILIASKRLGVASALSEQLSEAGFTPRRADSAEACRESLASEPAQAVLWDEDSLPAAEAPPSATILYLSAERASRQPSLRLPLRRSDLIERIRALAAPEDAVLALNAEWHLALAERALKHQEGRSIPLTEKESALVARLLSEPGRSLSREQLLEEIWGYGEDIATHTLETHLYRLRAKLKDATGEDSWIVATPEGYRIAV